MIEMAFYKGRARLFDRLIQWWTRGPYSHCEVATHHSASGAAWCISSSYLDGGVRGKWINLDRDHWDIVPVPTVDTAAAHEWLAQHAGLRYDLAGLLGFLWRPQTGSRRRWFCSEACAAILGMKEPWRFDPNTLACVVLELSEQNQERTQA